MVSVAVLRLSQRVHPAPVTPFRLMPFARSLTFFVVQPFSTCGLSAKRTSRRREQIARGRIPQLLRGSFVGCRHRGSLSLTGNGYSSRTAQEEWMKNCWRVRRGGANRPMSEPSSENGLLLWFMLRGTDFPSSYPSQDCAWTSPPRIAPVQAGAACTSSPTSFFVCTQFR